MEGTHTIQYLGYVASGVRSIGNGLQYDKYFPKTTDGTDPILMQRGTTYDTIDYIEDIVSKTLADTSKIARVLEGKNLKETSKNIWDFCYNNIQYHLDAKEREQLRRPARAWLDRKAGIDCDCFAIFISSILTNLGIEHSCRVVKIDGKGYFQHIYVVVPKFKNAPLNNRANYYVIDPVVDTNDDEPRGVTFKYDRNMTIPIQYLNGLSGSDDADRPAFGKEFDNMEAALEGVTDETAIEDYFMGCLKDHLKNTRDLLKDSQTTVRPLYNPHHMSRLLDHAIDKWEIPEQRQHAMNTLACVEQQAMNGSYKQFMGLDGLSELDFTENFGIIPRFEIEGLGVVEGIGLGYFTGLASLFSKIKDKIKKAASNVASAAKKVGAAAANAAKKVGAGVKKAVTSAGAALKKVAKAIVKYNPLSLAARGGFLLALKLNFIQLAAKLRTGYMTEAQATKNHIDRAYRIKAGTALKKVEDLFVRLGGNKEKMKEAILSGNRAINGLGDVGQLGIVVATAITAASGIIAAVLKLVEGLKGQKTASNPTGEATDEEKQQMDIVNNASSETVPDKQEKNTLPSDVAENAAASNNEASQSSNDPNPTSTGGGMSTMTKVLLAAGIITIGGVAYVMSNKKHAVNGVDDEETEEVEGLGRAKKTKKTIHVKIK